MDRLVPGTVLLFAAGVALHRSLSPALSAAALGLLAVAALAAGRVPSLRRRLPPPFGARLTPLLLALAAAAGAARAAGDQGAGAPDSLDRLLPSRPLPVVLEGTVLEAPDLPGEGEGAARQRARFPLETRVLRTSGGPLPASGRVLVRVEDAAPPLRAGDRIEVIGMARIPGGFRNPGVVDRGESAREKGLVRMLETPGPGAIRVLGRDGGRPADRAAGALRGTVLLAIRRAAPGRGGALLEALLVGRTEDLDPGLVRDFRRAGVWHVLVVSGLHAGLAAAAAAWILLRVGAGRGTRSCGAVAAAAAMAAASGFGQPALRATLALVLAAAAPLLRRRAEPLHAVFAAAGLFLALRPGSLFEPGFQLSFSAVLGILRLSPALGHLLFAKRRFLHRFPVPAADRSLRRRLGDLLERFLPASLAAWMATAPILAFHFGSFSPVAPLANLFVVPATSLLLVAAPPLLLLGQVLPGVTAPLLDGIAGLLGGMVHLLASLPGAWLPLPPVPFPVLALSGGALTVAALRPSGRWILAAAAGTALLASLPPAPPPAGGVPAAMVLDVGHGLSVLADSGEARILLDAGGRGARVAEDAILPALRARGALALDGLFLSHEDLDHYGAAAEILESIPVGAVIVNREFGREAAAREVLAAAAERGVPVIRAAAGDVLRWPGITVRILHPPGAGWSGTSDNDGSLVERVEMEGLSLLVTGDLEGDGLRRLLLSGEDLRADLLLLPHHGSPGTPGAETLAAATRARLVVASAGPSSAIRGPVSSPWAPRFAVTAEEGAVSDTESGTLRTGKPENFSYR